MNRKEEIKILITALQSEIQTLSRDLIILSHIDSIADKNLKLLELSRNLADYIHEYKTLK